LIRFLTIIGILGLWELLAGTRVVDQFFVGRPSLIAHRLQDYASDSLLWESLLTTLKEAAIGLGIGALIGCGTAFLFSAYRVPYLALDPIIYALYSLPRIALAPVMILWFGIGSNSKIALAASIVYFIMLLNTYVGITTVDRDLSNAVRLMGADRTFVHRTVTLPAILPWLVAGLRLSGSYALGAAIVGEMLGARLGLGTILVNAQQLFDTNGMFAVLVVIGAVAVLFNSAVKAVEKRVSLWRSDTLERSR